MLLDGDILNTDHPQLGCSLSGDHTVVPSMSTPDRE